MLASQLASKDIPWIDASFIDAKTIAGYFMRSLIGARHCNYPYDYWVLDQALPDDVADKTTALPFAVRKNKDFTHGTRESNNDYRVYFNAETQQQSDVCRAIADAFKDQRLINLIGRVSGKSLAGTRLRIEYCQDTNGFWLEPHVDISVKLFSMIIYLSDDPAVHDAGTDIYDDSPEHKNVATVPYEKGKAMFFIPGENTWHGFSKRPIHGIRKSLIVNYVAPDWRDAWELA